MSTERTVSIELPPLSDTEATHLLDVLRDLAQIVEAYYALDPRDRIPPDDQTIDLFQDELPF